MPIDEEQSFLKLTGTAGEEKIDDIKRWLAGDTEDVDLDSASGTDLVMALKAACDHYCMDIMIHADSIVRLALTDEYGPMEIVHGDQVFRTGKRFDWETIPIERKAELPREHCVNGLKRIRNDIGWMRKQIRRLESYMKRAKEKKEEGWEAPLKFEPDERPVSPRRRSID